MNPGARKERVVDTTSITASWKITLVEVAREVLERDGSRLEIGDKVVFYENANGDLIVRPA